jgi:hypothetical protein
MEGSLSFAALRAHDGTEALASPAGLEGRYDETVTLLDADIAAGSYLLEAYQRPCDGSCDRPGPVAERCTLEVTIGPDRSVQLLYTFTPGVTCTLISQ